MSTLAYTSSSDTPNQELRILVVDDDEDILDSIKDLLELEDESYIIQTANSFDNAIELANSFKPDLALLDIKLGMHNGIELVPILKNAFDDIICIMITAYRGTQYTIDSLRAGADDFIYKPLEPDHLYRTIRQFQQSQAMLREKVLADQRFRVLFNESFEYLFILDQTGKLIDINDVALKLMASDKASLLGRYFFDLPWWGTGEENRKHIADATRAALGGEPVRVEATVLDASQKAYTMDFSIKPVLDNNDDTIMIIPEGRDITATRQHENEILALNQDLENKVAERTRELEASRDEALRANSAKDVFLSQMSHELRTPMNAILGFTQILELDEASLEDNQKEYIQQIHQAGDHLLLLINQILDLSQLSSGKYVITPVDFDIRLSVSEALQSIQILVADKQLVVKNTLQDVELPLIRGDIKALHQVLGHLLGNAVKYNHTGGSLTITHEPTRPGFVRICITDTGKGIPEEQFDRVFTAFEHASTDNFNSGSGIGLAICKNIVELMSGTIGFSSEAGKGSRFWIELPVAEQPDS